MSNHLEELPTLGVGASLSLSSQPDPVSLVRAKGGPSFVEYSGLVDVDEVIDEVEKIRAAGAPVLFHPSYINFCGSYPNSNAWLEATSKHIESVGSSWFAQDVAYCFWEEGPGYSTQLGYFIPFHLSLINILSNLRLNVLKKYKPKLLCQLQSNHHPLHSLSVQCRCSHSLAVFQIKLTVPSCLIWDIWFLMKWQVVAVYWRR